MSRGPKSREREKKYKVKMFETWSSRVMSQCKSLYQGTVKLLFQGKCFRVSSTFYLFHFYTRVPGDHKHSLWVHKMFLSLSLSHPRSVNTWASNRVLRFVTLSTLTFPPRKPFCSGSKKSVPKVFFSLSLSLSLSPFFSCFRPLLKKAVSRTLA